MKFGDYVTVEMNRFNGDNEHYRHKVIRTLNSNLYADVPVRYDGTEYNHGEVVPVVACICCGVQENKVVRYAQKDVITEAIDGQ